MFIAIYVLLAFATVRRSKIETEFITDSKLLQSFSGMNIRDPSKQTISWTNTTSVNMSVPANDITPWVVGHRERPRYINGTYLNGTGAFPYTLENFTYFPDAVTSDTPIHVSKTHLVSDAPGNYNWPMWMFGVVAGALVVSNVSFSH